MPVPLPIGCRLQDRFEVVKDLGENAQGHLYRVFDRRTTEHHWLILEQLPPSPEEAIPFFDYQRQLGESLASFSHPMLAKCLDTFQESGRSYQVWEEVEGLTILQYVTMNVKGIEEEQALLWIADILGLTLALRQTAPFAVVADLPPESVIVTTATELKSQCPPFEMIEPNRPETEKYAVCKVSKELGSLLYLMLTRCPWTPDALVVSNVNPAISPLTQEFIERCLGTHTSRFSSLESLQKNLQDLTNTIRLMRMPKKNPWEEWEEKRKARPKGYRSLRIIHIRKTPLITLQSIFAGLLIILFGGNFLIYYIFPPKPAPLPIPPPRLIASSRSSLPPIPVSSRSASPSLSKQGQSNLSKHSNNNNNGLPGGSGNRSFHEPPPQEVPPGGGPVAGGGIFDPFIQPDSHWTPPPEYKKTSVSGDEVIETL